MSILARFSDDARKSLLEGATKAGRVLRATLGPSGRAVVIQDQDDIRVLDNGNEALQHLSFRDPFEQAGLFLLRDVAERTSNEAGDGTTTSAVLSESIFREGLRLVTGGVEPEPLRRELQRASRKVVDSIQDLTRPPAGREDFETIALRATKGDRELARLIARAFDEVGEFGSVLVDRGKGREPELKVRRGFRFDHGFLSSDFINEPETGQVRLESPRILLSDNKIADAKRILPLMKEAAQSDVPLLIIARTVERGALGTMVVNQKKEMLDCAAVEAPEKGPQRQRTLQDLAAFLDTTPLLEEAALDERSLSLSDLGRAEEVLIDEERTIIYGGAGSDERLRELIENLDERIGTAGSTFEKKRLRQRRRRLARGVAEIKTGGRTETDIEERTSRARDGMNAVREARSSGIVPGGGVTLLRAAQSLPSDGFDSSAEKHAIDILRSALGQPLRQIAENAGVDPDLVLRKVASGEDDFGYDAEGDRFGDMIEWGIIDAGSITRRAVENACSMAGLFLTTEGVITLKPGSLESGISKEHTLTAGML